MADRDIVYNFKARIGELLKAAREGKQSTEQMTGANKQLALSADEIREKMRGLQSDIGRLKDVDAIRVKQQELRDLGSELDRINAKQKDSGGGAGAGVAKGAFVGSLLGNIGAAALTQLPGMISSVASAMIDGNAQMEQYQASFETMLGSADAARGLLADLKKFGAETPFELPGLAQNAQLLKSFGMETDQILPTLKMLGDVSGGSQEKLNGLALVFAQVRSAGKLQGQDLMQMINQGFNPLQQISERTGKSMGVLKDEMSKGKVSFDMVRQAFVDATGAGGQFEGMMAKQSLTFEGLKSTFSDGIGEITRDIGGPVFESAKGGLLYVMDVLKRPEVQRVFDAIRNGLADLQTKFEDPKMQQALDLLVEVLSWIAESGVDAIFAAAGAFVDFQTSVIDVMDTLGLLDKSLTANARAQQRTNDALLKGKETAKGAWEETAKLAKEYEGLATKSKLTSDEERRRVQILEELKAQYPGYIDDTDTFATSLDGVREIGAKARDQIAGLTKDIAGLSEQSRQAQFVILQSEMQKVKEELRDLGYTWEGVNKGTAGLRSAKTFEELTAAMERYTEATNRGILAAKKAEDQEGIERQRKALEVGQKLYDLRLQALQLSGKAPKTDDDGGGDGPTPPPPADPADAIAGSVGAMEEKIQKLQDRQKNFTRAGTEEYARLQKEIENATAELERLRLTGDKLGDAESYDRMIEGVEEYAAALDDLAKYEDTAVEAETTKNDRVRQLRIDLIDDEKRQLMEQYAFKLEMIDREMISEEEKALKKRRLERDTAKEFKAIKEREREQNDKAAKAFEDRYARPIADAMTDMLASFADTQATAEERNKAFFDGMKKIALDAVSSIISGYLTQGIMYIAELVGLTAAQAPVAAAAGSMWAGPAALASTATFGGAAAAGGAGLAATYAIAQAMATPRLMAEGGVITRPTFAVAGEAGEEGFLPLRKLTQTMGEALAVAALDGRPQRRTQIGASRERPVIAEAAVSVFGQGGRAAGYHKRLRAL